MFPTREEALKLIRDGLLFNPGPWGKHCLTAAHCAEKIASACGDMDVEKAYILGLLHDIGRKFGVRHLGHVYDGYVYMKSLGYDEAAKICLTHSFNNHTIDEYIGKFDVTDEELTIIKTELAKTIYDEYDRLIQLCDCLAGAEGVLDMNEFIVENGFVNLDFMGNLGHSIVKTKGDRIYIEKENKTKIGDVKYFTFEPHIAFPDSKYGYKKENIYYFDEAGLIEL